jgi:hypothetical protein
LISLLLIAEHLFMRDEALVSRLASQSSAAEEGTAAYA